MPQDGWVTLGSGRNDDDGWTTLNSGQQEETPWYENVFTIPNALRLGGSALGAIGGGLATGGLGAAAGAFAGGAAGEAAGRWWEGKEFDPTITALEGALNVLPGGGAIPGKGAALKEIAKYGARAAGHGAWQGAVGSLPRHQAERGNLWDWNEWEMPSAGEIGAQTAAGTVIGGTLGTTLGAANVKYRNRMGAEGPPSPPPSPTWKQGDLPLGMDMPLNEPRQMPLPMGQPRKRDMFDRLNEIDQKYPYQPEVPPPTEQQLNLDLNAGNLFNTSTGRSFTEQTPFHQNPPPPPTAPTSGDLPLTGDAGAQAGTWPPVVKLQFPESGEIALWKSRGYVVSPQRSPEGYLQMVPQGEVTKFADKPTTPPAQPLARPEVPGPIGAGKVAAPVGDAPFPIPNNKVNPTVIANMEKNGFRVAMKTATHHIFKKIQGFVAETEGSFDPEALWRNLRRMLGRDPNVDELEAAVAREKQPHEQGGRVADFAPRQVPTPANNILAPHGPTIPSDTSTRYHLDYDSTTDEIIVVDSRTNQPVYRANNPGDAENFIHQREQSFPTPEQQAENQIPWEGPDVTGGTWESTRPTMDPRMNVRVEAGGPREFDFTQAPPEQGQLFPMEMRGQNQLRNISEQGMTSEPPRQGNMIDQLVDDEINGYLRAEDATPPEMIDLPAHFRNEFSEDLLRTPEKLAPVQRPVYPETSITRKPVNPLRPEVPPEQLTNQQMLELLRQGEEKRGEIVDPLNEFRPVDDDEPRFARVKGGGLTASANLKGAVENITRDYTKPLAGVINREAMQNSMDAAEKLGMNGVIRIRMNDNTNTMEMHDNGSGLDEETLAYKLIEIFSSGKAGEEGATGGKGIGSASYIYGGKHFSIETTAIDPSDGIKYTIRAGGTPEQFLDPVHGSDWEKFEVPPDTPTGTEIAVVLKDNHDMGDARDMFVNIIRHSRNRNSRVIADIDGNSTGPLSSLEADGIGIIEHTFNSSKDDKLIGDFVTTHRNSEVKVLIPEYQDTGSTSRDFEVHYLNNGMYQFSESMSLGGKEGEGVPPDVIVDIHPLVDDADELYPFINTREDIKRDMRSEIGKFLNEKITGPAISKRKNRTQELYDSMAEVPATGTKRKTIIYDPGNRLTPQEMASITANPTIQNLVQVYDELIDSALKAVGKANWYAKLEGVGIVFDDSLNGVHIPNPTTGKTTILINPFARIGQGLDPKTSAWKNAITNLHEIAHIGSERGSPIVLTPQDMQDPRLGKFFSEYLNQLIDHGDVGYYSTGHGMDFAHRLGEIFAKYGVQNTIDAAARIESIFTTGSKTPSKSGWKRNSGGYSSEIQRLLHLYQESRGRDATTEDLLSPTGVKQRNTGPDTEGNIPGNTEADGDGTSGWQRLKQSTGWGQGASKYAQQEAGKINYLREALAVPSAATTTLDFSAPGRQGLPMLFTRHSPGALKAMFQGITSAGFDKIDAELRSKDIFRPRLDENTYKELPSFAQEIGMKLFTPASKPGPRAEAVASKWLETGGSIPYLSAAYRNTIGVPVRATNRAFITFLNHLNANRTEFLLNKARDMSIEALDTGSARQGLFRKKFSSAEAENLNPYHNIVLAKEIADFVNTATGHGPLKTHLLPFKQAEVSLESAAKNLNMVLFSPGLLASRVRMMNPSTYIMASPFVRKQYLKAALSTAAAWYGFTTLIKNAAGDDVEVSDTLTSADFGKIRIGDTRLDAGGGFLQFLTAYGRLYQGGSTSSSSGEFHRFGSGYQAQTQEDMMERFMVNKLNPVAKFAYDLGTASEYNPFHVGDRMMQLFTPLIIQDVVSLAEEDPSLIPWLTPAAMVGMGTQTYSKGESVGKLLAPENDWLTTGGGPRDLMPWNISGDEDPTNFPWGNNVMPWKD